MKRAAIVCAVVLCAAAAFAQSGTSTRQPAVSTQAGGATMQTSSSSATESGAAAAIRKVADEYVKATLAGDAKAIAALYTDDGMDMPPNMPSVKGRPAVEQFYTQDLARGKPTSFTLNHLETRASGGVGYDVGTYQVSNPGPNGQPITDTGKYVVLVKGSGSTWKVAYAIYNSDRAMPGAPGASAQRPQ